MILKDAILFVLHYDEILAKTLNEICAEVTRNTKFDGRTVKMGIKVLVRKGMVKKFTRPNDTTKVNYYIRVGD